MPEPSSALGGPGASSSAARSMLAPGVAGRCCCKRALGPALCEVMSLSFCGLLLGVECPSLGQVLWPTGKFPLLCQIGTSVPLLPSLLAESLLAPALDWVSPPAPRTPPVVVVIDVHPAARPVPAGAVPQGRAACRTAVRECLHADGAPMRRLRQLSAMRFGRRQLHLWRERLFQIPF